MNSAAPLVKIIIPVYNAEEWLEACLDSIAQQTYKNIMVFLIDDHSKDSSYEICKKFASISSYPVVTYQNSVNLGPAGARNAGLSLALSSFIKDDLVMFLDADDRLYDAQALERIVQSYLQGPAVDICIGDGVRVYSDSPKEYILPILNGSSFLYTSKQDIDKLLAAFVSEPNTVIPLQVVWGKLFSGAFLRSTGLRFNEAPKAWEDIEFMFDALSQAKSISYSSRGNDKVCISYRRTKIDCISKNNYMNQTRVLRYIYLKMYSELYKRGLSANYLYWKGYTTMCVTSLYKLHQYMSPRDIYSTYQAAKEILADRSLREHMDCYDPIKNKNWTAIAFTVKHNFPLLTLLLFHLQDFVNKYF